MTQLEWDFKSLGTLPTGGIDGQECLHSSLTNPLTGEGLYCREYTATSSGAVFSTIQSSVDSGAYDITNTLEHYSIRAWVRIDVLDRSCGGIFIKGGDVGPLTTSPGYGYNLYFGGNNVRTIPTDFSITFSANNASGYPGTDTLFLDNLDISNPVGAAEWRRLRIDIKCLPHYDIVNCYMADISLPNTWALLTTQTIQSNFQAYIEPNIIGRNKIGYFICRRSTSPSSTYIDGFEVFKVV